MRLFRRAEKKRNARGKRNPFRARLVDVGLVLCGIGLAGGSAYLPWYIHTNPHMARPPKMTFARLDTVPDSPSEVDPGNRDALDSLLRDRPGIVPIAPEAVRNAVRVIADPTSTGALPQPVAGRNEAESVEQPTTEVSPFRFPTVASSDYVILYSDGESVLISDWKEVYPLSAGSSLPDGSSIVRLQKTGEGWTALTSRNVTIFEAR